MLILTLTLIFTNPCYCNRIKNNSSQPIKFIWKSSSSNYEEGKERSRLFEELNRLENIEVSSLKNDMNDSMGAMSLYDENNGEDDTDNNESYNENYDNQNNVQNYNRNYNQEGDENNKNYNVNNNMNINIDGEEEFEGFEKEETEARIVRTDERSEQMVVSADVALVRKYRNLRLALEKDEMEFVDDIFDIIPLSGTVWPGSEMEVSIIFKPDTAAQYTCLAYCDVTGRQERLPLQISGRGIGPNASLSFDVLDIGDIFINLEQSYEISIKNKGDITAVWTFMPPHSRFGNKFFFYPREGSLNPGEECVLSIRFESDLLGEFSEFFR